jgi:hypothetical protein
VTAIRGASLVLVMLVVAGCGSDGTKARRDAVNTYFGQVGTAQRNLLAAQGQINATLQGFSLSGTTTAELAQLRVARVELDQALRHVRTLDPPEDARRLQRLIVQRLALQRSVVAELIEAAVYIPKVAATARPIQAALVALRTELRAIGTSTVAAGSSAVPLDRYAVAFGGYGDALRPVSARLHALVAPPILRPGLDAERVAIARSIELCDAIRTALGRRDIVAANKAIHSLFSVSATLNGASTQARQAAAARAYDARLHQMDVLATKVNAERSRLVKLIG